MRLPPLARRALLLLANILIPLACYIFATGFFPYKPLLPGLAAFQEQDATEELGLLREKNGGSLMAERPGRLFDKVIFMVVDALRSDFVYGEHSGFHNVHSLIRDGGVLPFTAHAAAPTVTMPRVKALTTGSVPSFADLILNLDESDTSSSLANQDTWLAQIRQHLHEGHDDEIETGTGRLVFYGDDTWLKLFPDFFDKHDGTSSFFVSDFTEVDNNVTRHIPTALQSRDWDAMILHYLGLDHIGHKTGPQGPNMIPKQREMDTIIKQIYEALEAQAHLKDTLLVVAGDHGMNSAGNHGGSAAGETSTALLFASPKLKSRSRIRGRKQLSAPVIPRAGTEFDFYSKIQQSDLVPSLSALLDIPIAKNSLGVVPTEILDLYKDEVLKGIKHPQIHLLYRNALQMLNIVKATYGAKNFQNLAGQRMSTDKCRYGWHGMLQLQCLWGRATRMVLAASIDERFSTAQQVEALRDFLVYAQDDLSATASSYDVQKLVAGIVIAACASFAAFCSFDTFPLNSSTLAFASITLLYAVMMFASSFVEEEQHIWYWATSAWLATLSIERLRTSRNVFLTIGSSALVLSLHRLANRWNQTGQKFAGEPDIARSFFPNQPLLLWGIIIGVYIGFGQLLVKRSFKGIFNEVLSGSLASATIVAGLIFKYNFTVADAPELIPVAGGYLEDVKSLVRGTDLIFQARAVFLLLGLSLISILAGFSAQKSQYNSHSRVFLVDRIMPLLGLLLLTQSRAVNNALLGIFALQMPCLEHLLLGRDWPNRNSDEPEDPDHQPSGNEDSPHSHLIHSATQISVTILLLAYASFYQLGNSNAISSIDLSQAYNGVSSYSIVAVGVLLFLSNWAGPIWWTTVGVSLLLKARNLAAQAEAITGCSARQMLDESNNDGRDNLGARSPVATNQRHVNTSKHKQRHQVSKWGSDTMADPSMPVSRTTPPDMTSAYQRYLTWTTLFTASSLAATMLSCTILRTHLFIWTVFSPKYLYAVAWALGWHLLINIGWAGGLWLAK